MTPLLSRQLLLVTGKGGVGKTTAAVALGVASARRGRRTIVCEVGAQARVPALFGREPGTNGVEVQVDEGLWAVSIDPQRALEEWMATVVGRAPTSVLARSQAFAYFVAAAPGAREVLTMVKLWELAQERRWDRGAAGYDLVVVDAPATGHALAMLRTPRTFADLARVGPVARQAAAARDLVADERRSAVLAVTLPSEMPVTETLELGARLRAQVGRSLEAVVANGVVPDRFDAAAVQELSEAVDGDPRAELRAAVRAARAERARAAAQGEQLGRLRAGVAAPVVELPFLFVSRLGVADVRELADELAASLG